MVLVLPDFDSQGLLPFISLCQPHQLLLSVPSPLPSQLLVYRHNPSTKGIQWHSDHTHSFVIARTTTPMVTPTPWIARELVLGLVLVALKVGLRATGASIGLLVHLHSSNCAV